VVLATGVTPRKLDIPGSKNKNVLTYVDVLYKGADVGKRVAIVGAGGIGFDVAEFITTDKNHSPSVNLDLFLAEWGIDKKNETRGGIIPPKLESTERVVYLLQRKSSKHGESLGKTTGWIHRTTLKNKKVNMIGGIKEYNEVDEKGLYYTTLDGKKTLLEVDTIISCVGQHSLRDLEETLKTKNILVHLIGGAHLAAELDAKRAINQASKLAASI